MGSSSSQPAEVAKAKTCEVVKVVRSQNDPNITAEQIKECEAAVQEILDKQLNEMRDEVKEVEQIITDDVIDTVKSIEDSVLLSYEQLEDMSKIEANIEQVFKGFPAVGILVDTATSMIAAMKNTTELKKMFRWQQRKVIQRMPGKLGEPDKVVGLELHYKVKIIEESTAAGIWSKFSGFVMRAPAQDKKKTVVLVAYKCLAHTMALNADDYLDKEELDNLVF